MIKHKVGDLVWAPFQESKWPGKIINIDVMADVKLFRTKLIIKVSPALLLPYDSKDVTPCTETGSNKTLIVAIKMADKIKNEGIDHSINLAQALPLVKEEEENNKCKEEEEEEARESALPRSQSVASFLLTLDQKILLQECRQNTTSFLTFFNTTTNAQQRIVKTPKMVMTFFFENYLNDLLDETYKGDRMTLHRKIANILSYHVIDLSVILRTHVQKLMLIIINQYKKGGDKMMEKTINSLMTLQAQIEQELSNHLQNYTNIALVMKPIYELCS